MVSPKHIVLIGNGAWGQNYVKTLADFPNVYLTVAKKESWKGRVSAGCDGVIIATQPDSHVDIALFCLELGIPCLIDKPLALTYEDAARLKPYDKLIMVNYIHLFAPEFEKLVYTQGDFVRVTSMGPVVREGYSPVLDYGCHALAMLLNKTGTLNNAKINVGHGEKQLELIIGDQLYTTGEPILGFTVQKFLDLIDGQEDERFGVNMSLHILAALA